MPIALIIDNNPLWRSAIRNELALANFHQIIETGSPHEALKCIQTINPSLIVIDIDLNELDGINFIYELRGLIRKTSKICVFTHLSKDLFASASIKAGAHAFLAKSQSHFIIRPAIETIRQGYKILPDTMPLELWHKTSYSDHSVLTKLSARESNVLSLLLKGLNNALIAHELGLSAKTVSTYKHRILAKLGVDNINHIGTLPKQLHDSRTPQQALLFNQSKDDINSS